MQIRAFGTKELSVQSVPLGSTLPVAETSAIRENERNGILSEISSIMFRSQEGNKSRLLG
jgi:hypothetical protein